MKHTPPQSAHQYTFDVCKLTNLAHYPTTPPCASPPAPLLSPSCSLLAHVPLRQDLLDKLEHVVELSLARLHMGTWQALMPSEDGSIFAESGG